MADGKKGDYRPPEMTVRDVVFGEPDKDHQIGVSLLVFAGNRLAQGVTYQFLVNGGLVGNPQTVIEGRATGKIKLASGKSTVSVELRHPYFGVRIVPIAEKETEPKKKKGEVSRLEILGETSDEETLFISLARLDKSGKGKKGKVSFFNPNTGDVEKMDSDDNGVATIQINLSDKRQTVTFYLPEKPGEKVIKEIPAKKVTPQIPQPQPQKKSLADRMREAYRRGRQG
jgi:hypothetical protein